MRKAKPRKCPHCDRPIKRPPKPRRAEMIREIDAAPVRLREERESIALSIMQALEGMGITDPTALRAASIAATHGGWKVARMVARNWEIINGRRR